MVWQVYALRRLARGLASSHDAARQGFALALAAALARVPEIESLPALDLLDAALEVSKSMKVAFVAQLASHSAEITEKIVPTLGECTLLHPRWFSSRTLNRTLDRTLRLMT